MTTTTTEAEALVRRAYQLAEGNVMDVWGFTAAELAAEHTALVMEPDRGVRETLRMALEDEGYRVQTAPDATAGLQVLRDSARPLTVLFDVVPLPHLSRERNGLALLDALAQDTLEGHGLARHDYVLMSANPARALAGVERVPARLQMLPMPFSLDDLRARLERVDEWLRFQPLPQERAATGGLGQAPLSRRPGGFSRNSLPAWQEAPSLPKETTRVQATI